MGFDVDYSFDIPQSHKSIIKVIGVGGGGSNAVTSMFNQGIKGVEFIVVNTDAQALNRSLVPNKLQIGTNLTEGLGAGANPEKGRDSAIESKEEIRELLAGDTKMVFVTAGMGGGTGTGAAPVIAQVAKELGILTVGIVTAPYTWEGPKKRRQAEKGIQSLKKHCDTVLVVMNDRLMQVYSDFTVKSAYNMADNVLTNAAKSIAELITVPQEVNVDFNDVKTIMESSGSAVMGSAEAEGSDRAIRAVSEAMSSPLLDEVNVKGAKGILFSVTYGTDELKMNELQSITNFIFENVGDEAEVIHGIGEDADMGKKVRVTIIATGFDSDAAETIESTTGVEPTSENHSIETTKKVVDLDSEKEITVENEIFSIDDLEDMPLGDAEDKLFAGNKVVFDDKGGEYRVEDKKSTHNERMNQEFDIRERETKERLQDQGKSRIERLKTLGSKVHDLRSFEKISKEEFNEQNDVPAYLRRNKKLKDIPHSSERSISRLNLNEESELIGNNKFLHDNVD